MGLMIKQVWERIGGVERTWEGYGWWVNRGIFGSLGRAGSSMRET